MTRDRASGLALIVGALAGLVTMALHPTGHDLAQAVGRSEWPARLNVFAHSLAIAASPMLLFGAIGLTHRISSDHGLAALGLVTYGFALVAVTIAAAASGLIAPQLIQGMVTSTGTERELLHAALDYNSRVNQAFAAVFVLMASAAIGFWSVAMLRARAFPRWIGIFGCIVTALIVVGFVSGHLRLTIHGFGAIMVAQSAWLIAVGILLQKTATDGSRAL